jgi:ribosomal protein L11 methylase PrmA
MKQDRSSVAEPQGTVEPSSFRDPSGFLFRDLAGVLLRQVNRSFGADYDLLMQCGLYDALVRRGQLVEHEELPESRALTSEAHCVLRPREIPFVSYPSEWCFSQLKDAALLTLDVALLALQHGMILKDATAYNVQFEGAQPIFIDSLSFERYVEGEPWVAYSQFCRHFLAPLALAATRGMQIGQFFATQVSGVDLQLAARLLPKWSLLSPGLLMHVHLNSRFQASFSDTTKDSMVASKASSRPISKAGLTAILLSLRKAVAKLNWSPGGTEWADYYSTTSYDSDAFQAKQAVVRRFITEIKPDTVWDLGANTGVFSRIAAESGAHVCAFDIDPACVEKSYLALKHERVPKLLPLVMDIASPTPAIGWALKERRSLIQRGPCDAVLALALIHHLVIGNNVPLAWLAEFLSGICKYLIIEFVPKSDPQVRRLLRSRKDIFDDYDLDGFRATFGEHFSILDSEEVGDDGRQVFLMAVRESPPGHALL